MNIDEGASNMTDSEKVKLLNMDRGGDIEMPAQPMRSGLSASSVVKGFDYGNLSGVAMS